MRARSNPWVWLAGFLLAAMVWAPAAGAQVVPDPSAAPADSVAPGDSVPAIEVSIPPDEVGGDTIPEAIQEAAEVRVPPTPIPLYPTIMPPGWHAGRWQWSREEIARLPGLTILEFIEMIPGVTRYRAGGFGRPEGITALGAGGARVRVMLDGFELDPLGSGSFPIETMAVQDLTSVRVERSISEIRVDLETFRLETPEPFSIVELGTGIYQTRVLRALFSRGFGQRVIGTAGLSLANTFGFGIREDYSHSNTFLRTSYALSPSTGLQLDFRRTAIDRAGTAFPQQATRGDLILRGRSQLTERTVVEVFVGRSSNREEADPSIPERLISIQGGARAALATERLSTEVTGRVRLGDDDWIASPKAEAEGRVVLVPVGALRFEGTARAGTAGDGATASEGRVVASVSPVRGLSVFGSASLGTRLVPAVRQSDVVPPEGEAPGLQGHLVVNDATGWRAGGEVAGAFGAIHVAAFQTEVSEVMPFGLGFDRGSPSAAVPADLGIEGAADLPVPLTRGNVRLQAWYSRFLEGDRPYAPVDLGRLSLVFHHVYYGGQFEPTFRLEGVHRGASLVPDSPGDAISTRAEAYQTLHFSLQLRIIDVTAFLIWDNLLNQQTANDFPQSPPAYPRIVYGASWHFSN